MTKKLIRIGFTILLLGIIVANSGCEKWRNNRETVTCFDHAVSEASFNDIIRTVMLVTSETGGLISDTCYILTWSGASFPRTAILNYGSVDCEGLYGPPTTGVISITISDTFSLDGATATVTLNDVVIDEYSVQGELTIANMGKNAAGNIEFSFVVNNGIVTINSDKIITWGCNYTYELVETNVQGIVFDDVYRVTGTASGVNSEGRAFEVIIKESLLKELDCRWMRSGVTEVLPSDLKDRELNYGDKACEQNSNCCDNEAEVTINDRKDYTLRMK